MLGMIPINYLAVLVAAIAQIVIGFLWYGPLFGKTWIRLTGKSDMAPAKGVGRSYAIMALGSLVMSYVLAHSLIFGNSYLNTDGASAAFEVAFWTWLGFIAPVLLGSVLWEGKPWKLWALNAVYYLVSLIVMALILVMWA
jgi:hypothetical protein